jgi:2-isopropylmalate synthase
MFPKKVSIYDTTLRDGTQAEGISLSVHDKIRIAERLDVFGIHYIEGGWPGSNPKDIEFFSEAKKRKWKTAKLCAFGSTCRANLRPEDDTQVGLLIKAETPVVTIVGKGWRFHVEEILGVTVEENLRMKAIQTAAESGADLVVLCDTNGGTLTHEIEGITRAVIEAVKVPVGIHTHNDCELGAANALAGLQAGAIQIQGTINGYGERTGNCNLTSIIPLLQLKLGIEVVPDLRKLRELSLFVDDLANCQHNIRAPFVGSASFTHKGGLHANAVIKLAKSYEHISPESVGNFQRIVVSELSGQSNIMAKARELGFTMEKGSPAVSAILREVKRLEHLGYEFEAAEASLELLIRRVLSTPEPLWELLEYHCTYMRSVRNRYETCEATVKLRVGNEDYYTVAEGDGPVNALDAALRKALTPVYPEIQKITLDDYKVRIIGSHVGTEARTRVLVDSTDHHENWCTVGVSDNIIEASWLALVDSYEYKLRRS